MVGFLSKMLGLVMIPTGFFLTLMILGFASMIDPSLPDSAWWAEYWGRLILKGEGLGVVPGLVMVLIGVRLSFVREEPASKVPASDGKTRRYDFD